MNDFGKYVAACRKKAGFSQAKLAKICGYGNTMIALIETGDRFPSLKQAQKLAEAVGISWQEFARHFNAGVEGDKKQKLISALQHYQQRFDGQKTSDPFLQEIFSSFKSPQELMEIEARAHRVAIFTHNFWSDFKSFALEPAEQTEETRPYTTQFTHALRENLTTRGVEYRYFYPVDEPGIEQPLQAVQKLHQDLGSKSTTFHAVSGSLQWGLFAGYERVFYFDPEHEIGQKLPYNLGFSIDKLGVQSPFHFLLHERILDQHLERYNNAIQHML